MPYKEYTIFIEGESFASGVTLLHDETEIFDEWLTSNEYECETFIENENGNLTAAINKEGIFELVVHGD